MSAGTESTTGTVSEKLIRLEGKLDAYAAGQNATLIEHGRRLDGHDRAIEDLRIADVPEKPAPPTSGWQIAGVLISALIGLGSLLTLLILLMQIVPALP